MKLTKTLICALAVGAMTFVTNAASLEPILLARINFSGLLIINTNLNGNAIDNGRTTTLKPLRRSFASADIVKLLNASTNFQTYLAFWQPGITNLPTGTYFAYDIYGYNGLGKFYAILPNGHQVPMDDVDFFGTRWPFIGTQWFYLSSQWTEIDATQSGSESDQLAEMSIRIRDFKDTNELDPDINTDINLIGQMLANFSAGKTNGATRTLTVSVNFSGSGNAEWQGHFGTATGRATGSGSTSSTFNKGPILIGYWPFWYWLPS